MFCDKVKKTSTGEMDMSTFNQFFLVILLVLIAALFFYNVWLTEELQTNKAYTANLQMQIDNLKTHSTDQVDQYKAATAQAQKQAADAQEKINRLLSQKSPKNCRKGFRWGIEQAKKFNK